MDTFLLCAFWFFIGWIFGVGLLVLQGHRPHGFRANNGKRYRLIEVR